MTLKILLFAITFIAGTLGGIALQQTVLEGKPATCPQCPSLTCPPSTEVRLQTLDMEQLKKIRGDFNYSPQLHNVQLVLDCKQDSILLKQLLKGHK